MVAIIVASIKTAKTRSRKSEVASRNPHFEAQSRISFRIPHSAHSAFRIPMNFPHFFIDRPIFAGVISIVITLVGVIALSTLPIAQYPQIAPPTIQVTTNYPGANAKVVSETVATPIEQQVNGVENMLYMSSQSTSDGNMTLSITFKLGTNLDTAQVLVQNRVAIAIPVLPPDVQRIGVTTKKQSPDITMVVHLVSPDGSLDSLFTSNYALLQVRDELARVDGVGDINVFGAREYSMRIWLDPNKISSRGLTAQDVVTGDSGAECASRGGNHRRAARAERRDGLSIHGQHAGPARGRKGVRRHHHQDWRRRASHARARCRAG